MADKTLLMQNLGIFVIQMWFYIKIQARFDF